MAGEPIGRELDVNDDLSKDYDPETNPHANLDLDEFDKLLDEQYGDGPPKEVKPAPKPQPKAEEKPEAEAEEKPEAEEEQEGEEQPEEAAEGEQAPSGEAKEVTPDILAEIREELRAERLRREKSEIHAARLAAKLGNIEKRLNDRSTTDLDEVEAPERTDRLTRIEARLDAEARERGIREELAAFDARPEIQELAAVLPKVAPKFMERMEAARALTDPTEARLAVKEMCLDLLAEAREVKTKEERETAARRRTEATGRRKEAIKDASVTGTDVRSSATRTKKFDPATASEEDLDARIEADLAAGRYR